MRLNLFHTLLISVTIFAVACAFLLPAVELGADEELFQAIRDGNIVFIKAHLSTFHIEVVSDEVAAKRPEPSVWRLPAGCSAALGACRFIIFARSIRNGTTGRLKERRHGECRTVQFELRVRGIRGRATRTPNSELKSGFE